jgi:hypothetical protein
MEGRFDNIESKKSKEKINLPEFVKLNVLCAVENAPDYLKQSLALALEGEEENIDNLLLEEFKKIENREENQKEKQQTRIKRINFFLKKIKEEVINDNKTYIQFKVPESLQGISDYFPPTPETYKFFIFVQPYQNEAYDRNQFLICGLESGLPIEPFESDEGDLYWKIFGSFYLLERDKNNEIKVYLLSLNIVKNLDNKKIKFISIECHLLDKESVKNHKNLSKVIEKFQKGEEIVIQDELLSNEENLERQTISDEDQ